MNCEHKHEQILQKRQLFPSEEEGMLTAAKRSYMGARKMAQWLVAHGSSQQSMTPVPGN